MTLTVTGTSGALAGWTVFFVSIPVTVNVPPDEPDAPSKGVTVQRDSKGNVIGVTPI